MPDSPLVYVKKQLGVSLADITELSKQDRDDLKTWAIEEMKELGLA